MKNFPRILLLPALILALAAPSAAQVEVRKIEADLFPAEAEMVHVELSFGPVTVQGTDGRNVEAEVRIECDRQDLEKCRRRAERIRLRPRIKKGTLIVKLKKTPRGRMGGIKATMLVRVPRDLVLDVNTTSGGVYVGGMRSHVEIDAASGDVDLVHERARVASVEVDVAFGKADLWLAGERVKGTGFPRALKWRGSGKANLNVDIGTGDASVRLE